MDDTFQTVYTMDDYYDGPRSGVANFDGRPHYYRSIYLDTPEYSSDEDRFELSPVTTEVLTAACEVAAIFERWDIVRRETPNFTYTDEEFGALPAERNRFHDLKQFLTANYTTHEKKVLVHGEFRNCASSSSGLQVRWRLAE